MSDCLFCKIANHEIETNNIVYEDEYVMAFDDIAPEAPVHVLVVPKVHITDFEDLNDDNMIHFEKILKAIKKVTKLTNVSEKGYRIVNNCKEDGGQVIGHLHFHVLGGKKL